MHASLTWPLSGPRPFNGASYLYWQNNAADVGERLMSSLTLLGCYYWRPAMP